MHFPCCVVYRVDSAYFSQEHRKEIIVGYAGEIILNNDKLKSGGWTSLVATFDSYYTRVS